MKTKTETRNFEINLEDELKITNPKKSKGKNGKATKFLFKKSSRLEKIYLNHKYFSLFNLIYFILFLFLSPKNILSSDYYIELKVTSTGYQEILSDKFTGGFPSAIYVNKEVQILRDRKVYVESENHIIKLEWENRINNFTYMFFNVTSIKYAKMNYITQYNSNMSYMFYNCYNLNDFIYEASNTISYAISDTISMFYNCSNLTSFSFKNLYLNQFCNNGYWSSDLYYCYSSGYRDKYRNMSYMFYNCQNLANISFSNEIAYINDMKGMFYNCISLTSIDVSKFKTKYDNNYYADLSYMFYNCRKLSSLDFSSNFYVKDMNSMLYNCISLETININNFYSHNFYSHYINASRLFYNCYNLRTINGNFDSLYMKDTREMFYNCSSLEYNKDDNYFEITIANQNSYMDINMSCMFYNCKNLQKVNIQSGGYNNYLLPTDFRLMFYNCVKLTRVDFSYYSAHSAQNMSYMFYNCVVLQSFNGDCSDKSNSASLIAEKRTMKGMFQNCKELTTLTWPSSINTKNVEIMWDMFKGCSNLKVLDLNNFDTSQVTDMESMFEECSSLDTLSLSSFNTDNVQYMNRMFYNCKSLKSLNFNNITSKSLGTMHHMFYNCSSLQYLNLFSLTEKDQSIEEMFKGASTNFQFCIKENEDMPNIFKELFEMQGTKRVCNNNCYPNDNNRVSIETKKLCCKDVEYEGSCYENCPKRTRVNGENTLRTCKNFSCPYDNSNPRKIYYNYNQSDCIASIPRGYFLDNEELKTIDKCHDDCVDCEKRATDSSTNCKTCIEEKPHIYKGNCYKECLRGKYNDTLCFCFDEKCELCPEEAALDGLCSICSKDYYKKAVDVDKTYFDCFKNLEKHYLKNNLYYSCYQSCQTCNISGEEALHNCLTCDSNNSFPFKKQGYYNCYPNCTYFFYFQDNNEQKYTCTEDNKCPATYDLIVADIGQCIQDCQHSEYYKYQFLNKCYSYCPEDTIEIEGKEYFCKLSCPFERPFMIKSQQICVSNCTIIDRRDEECVTNYFGNRSNFEIQDKILTDIEDHLTSNTFNFTMINDENIIIKEKDTNYELTTTNKKTSNSITSSIDLAQCEETLRDYYSISPDKILYLLKYDVFLPGKEGPTVEYRVYYPLENPNNLELLDLTICEGKAIVVSYGVNITGDPDLYNKNSPYYNDLCVSYKTSDGIDMTIEDRQKQYIDNNKSLCEEDCTFVAYYEETKKVDCSCGVKFNLPLVSEITIDKNKLYKFMDIKKIANFDVLKCYKLLASKVGLITNFGFYLYIPSIITYFLCVILFYVREFNQLKKQINDIVYAKKILKYIEDKSKKKPKPKPKPQKPPEPKPIIKGPKYIQPIIFQVIDKMQNLMNNNKNKKSKTIKSLKTNDKTKMKRGTKENKNENILIEDNNIDNEVQSNIKDDKNDKDNNLIDNDIQNKKPVRKKKKNSKKNAPPIKETVSKPKPENTLVNKNLPTSGNNKDAKKKGLELITYNYLDKIDASNDINNEEKEKIKIIMKYNDSELNVLDFQPALKYDTRNYFQYYFSLLKTKHIIIKIISKTDYNSRMIKIYLAFFHFSLCLTVNALFFNDGTMHKIMEDGGDFNIIYQLPQIIYSAIITFIFENILNFLALSEENVLSIKHEKIFRLVPRKAKEIIRVLQIKFLNFFLLSFALMIAFWYYVSCFCAVYRNTQYHLIKDTLISYGTSMLTPLGLNLIPGLFRIPGLKNHKEFLYLLSKIIQLF